MHPIQRANNPSFWCCTYSEQVNIAGRGRRVVHLFPTVIGDYWNSLEVPKDEVLQLMRETPREEGWQRCLIARLWMS